MSLTKINFVIQRYKSTAEFHIQVHEAHEFEYEKII